MRYCMVVFVVTLLFSCAFAQSNTSSASGVPAQQIEVNLRDVHFDFNEASLRYDAQATLQENAQWLKAHPEALVTIEGGADERGDIVYNLVLSDMRAKATKDALVGMGVPAGQIVFATGWGKLYPVCSSSTEECWSQNRRAHLSSWEAMQGVSTASVESPQTKRVGQ